MQMLWPAGGTGLLVGRPPGSRCPSLIAPKIDGLNYIRDWEQVNLPNVDPLLVKIERWILCADYV